MKKLVFLLALSFIACKDTVSNDPSSQTLPKITQDNLKQHPLCFRSIVGASDVAKDSLLMHLDFKGDAVTGTYDWIPANKDARHGKILANKYGKTIKGSYEFKQEGQHIKQPIVIDLRENSVKVTTNPKKKGQMEVQIAKVSCD